MINRNWPYAWAVVIMAWSWYMTHEFLFGHQLAHGNPMIEVSLISIGYALTLLRSLPKIIQWPQLGHLVVFVIATFIGFAGSNLECICRIIYFFVLLGTAVIWACANIIFVLARMMLPAKMN